nr:hypothetical protein [uncultured Desulfobulbus sp.]
MRTRNMTISLIIATWFFSAAAHATPTVMYNGGFAVGIQGLELSGAEYRVDFIEGSYNSIYQYSAPLFLGNESGAAAAADAIMNVLNAEVVTPHIGINPEYEVLWVPYLESAGDFRTEQRGYSSLTDSWGSYADFQGGVDVDYAGKVSYLDGKDLH